MAMEGRGGIEPPLKRQRLERIWYRLNTNRVQIFNRDTEMLVLVAELAKEIDCTEATVIHKGVELGVSDKIPVTSAGDPLHFITEVGKFFLVCMVFANIICGIIFLQNGPHQISSVKSR